MSLPGLHPIKTRLTSGTAFGAGVGSGFFGRNETAPGAKETRNATESIIAASKATTEKDRLDLIENSIIYQAEAIRKIQSGTPGPNTILANAASTALGPIQSAIQTFRAATVGAPITESPSISFPNVIESVEMGSTLNLTPTIPGREAVTYTSSATGVATVDAGGIVAPVAPGTTTITGTLPGGQSATVEVTVTAGAPPGGVAGAGGGPPPPPPGGVPLPPVSGTTFNYDYYKSNNNRYFIRIISSDAINTRLARITADGTDNKTETLSTAAVAAKISSQYTGIPDDKKITDIPATILVKLLPLVGGARKTRSRKMNRRRKTGKKVKPSRPSQLSSQQLF